MEFSKRKSEDATGVTTVPVQDAGAVQRAATTQGYDQQVQTLRPGNPTLQLKESSTVRTVSDSFVSEGDRSTTKTVSDDTSGLTVRQHDPVSGGSTEDRKRVYGHIMSTSYSGEPRAVMFHRSGKAARVQYVGEIWADICESNEPITITDPETHITKTEPLRQIVERFIATHGGARYGEAYKIWLLHNGVFYLGQNGGQTFDQGDETFQQGFEQASKIDPVTGQPTAGGQALAWGEGSGPIQKGIKAREVDDGKIEVDDWCVPGAGIISTLPFRLVNGEIVVDVNRGDEPTTDSFVSAGDWRIIPRSEGYLKGMYNLPEVLPNFPFAQTKPAMPDRFMTLQDKATHREDKVYDFRIDYVGGHFKITVSMYPLEKHNQLPELGTSRQEYVLEGAAADEYMRTHYVNAPTKKRATDTDQWWSGMSDMGGAGENQLNAGEEFFLRQYQHWTVRWATELNNGIMRGHTYLDSLYSGAVDACFEQLKATTQKAVSHSRKLAPVIKTHWDQRFQRGSSYAARYIRKSEDQTYTYESQYDEIARILQG